MRWILLLLPLLPPLLTGCASSVPVAFLCNDENVEIYVNGEFVGHGLIQYVVPKDVDYITVSAMHDGQIVYDRNYYVRDYRNSIIEIIPRTDYRYSSGNSKER